MAERYRRGFSLSSVRTAKSLLRIRKTGKEFCAQNVRFALILAPFSRLSSIFGGLAGLA